MHVHNPRHSVLLVSFVFLDLIPIMVTDSIDICNRPCQRQSIGIGEGDSAVCSALVPLWLIGHPNDG